MAVGYIRCLSFQAVFLPVCGVKIHQQTALTVGSDGKPQAVQPGKARRIVPAQPQRRRQQADDPAFGGFPVGLAGFKFGVRPPCLQGRGQPKQ